MPIPPFPPEVQPHLLKFMNQMVRPGANVDVQLAADLALHAANEAQAAINRVAATGPRGTEALLITIGALIALAGQAEAMKAALQQISRETQS